MSTRIPFQLFPRTNKTFTSFGVEVMPRLKMQFSKFQKRQTLLHSRGTITFNELH